MRLGRLIGGLRFFAGLFFTTSCLAQSVDLPLQLVQSTAGARLIVNIGINGQSPLPYLFDTGSTMFNAFYNTTAFGNNFTSSVANLPSGLNYSYAKHTDTITVVGVPSLTFYSSTTAPTGVTLNALTPSGAASNFLIGAVMQRDGVNITNQTASLEAVPGGFQGLYGTFGAADFAACRTTANINLACGASAQNTFVIGSVLGQSTSGASAGYVVSANGQPLSGLVTNGATNPGSNVNGPQVGQNVTSCSPCVILGLTPALRAQFRPINTMPWIGGATAGVTGFPNSGAPSSSEFGINMNVAIGPNGQVQLNGQPTLLDTGTQNFELLNPSANPSAYGVASGGVYQLGNGTLVSITGSAAGATATNYQAFQTGSFSYPGVYATSVDTTGSTNNTIGLGFFLMNSVMYDLNGQVTGYSSNFVTDTNITSTASAPLTIGSNSVPLGLAGVISGSGGVNITSGGSATLSAANTYTGPTNITGGYLGLVGPVVSIKSSSAVNLASNGLFDISDTTNGATINTLADDGTGIVALGSQVLTIQNASSTFGGSFISSGGGLAINGGTQILTGANLNFGSATIGSGATLQLGNGGTMSSITGNIANIGTLAFNLSGTYAYNGVITGAGSVDHSGTGVASHSGTHTYTGATTIENGTLSVNGDISSSSSLTVSSGGTIAGNATLPTTTIGATGTISPGNSVGAMRISGNFSLLSGGVFTVDIGSGSADKISVSGKASIAGALNTKLLGLTFSPKTHTVIDATGGLTGTFAGLPNGSKVSLSGANASLVANPKIVYTANTAAVSVDGVVSGALTSLLPSSATANQRAVAQAIDMGAQRSSTPAAFDSFLNLSPGALPAALSQVSGEASAGAAQTGFQTTGAFLDTLIGRSMDADQIQSETATFYAPQDKPTAAAAGIAAATSANALTSAPRWGVWASAFGGYMNLGGNSAVGSNSSTTRISGIATGADYRLSSNVQLGFSLGGGSSSWGLANSVGSGTNDMFLAGLYGTARFGNSYLSGGLAYGNQSVSTSRTGYNGSFVGQSFGLRAETGRRFAAGEFTVTPFAALNLMSYRTPAYSESPIVAGSGPLGLSYASNTSQGARSEAGAMIERAFALMGDQTMILRARAAWGHNWNSSPSVTATFQTLPGSVFTVLGVRPASDLVILSAESEYRITQQMSLSAKFNGQFGQRTSGYGATGTLRFIW